MKVLVGCEYSATVRREFEKLGHDAWSCDLLPSTYPYRHIQGDIFEAIKKLKPDLLIAHPPCTYLSVAGNSKLSARITPEHEIIERKKLREEAFQFVKKIWNQPIKYIAIENPVGYLNTHPDFPQVSQIIHPYYFGEPHLKRTCLWLKNLPILHHDPNPIKPKPIKTLIRHNGKIKNCYFNYLASHNDNGHQCSKTFPSIAKAMAEQWTWWMNLKERLQCK